MRRGINETREGHRQDDGEARDRRRDSYMMSSYNGEARDRRNQVLCIEEIVVAFPARCRGKLWLHFHNTISQILTLSFTNFNTCIHAIYYIVAL